MFKAILIWVGLSALFMATYAYIFADKTASQTVIFAIWLATIISYISLIIGHF